MQKQQLWALVEGLCEEEGVSLFDIDVPATGSGTLRVYINGVTGVQHSHCAGVSHRIINHERVEEILPGNTVLEVSSPGINRKLSRPEHFVGAVGERLRVSYKDTEGKKTTVTGNLKQFAENVLEVVAEAGKENREVSIPLQSVIEARVDFLFE